jgi:hypothetical protein
MVAQINLFGPLNRDFYRQKVGAILGEKRSVKLCAADLPVKRNAAPTVAQLALDGPNFGRDFAWERRENVRRRPPPFHQFCRELKLHAPIITSMMVFNAHFFRRIFEAKS